MSVLVKFGGKNNGRLSKGVSVALRKEVRPSKIGAYKMVLWAAERWSEGSAPTIVKPRCESIGKLFNFTPFNLGMEGAR